MQTDIKRVERLTKYIGELIRGGNGKELYQKYKEDIEAVKPQEVFKIFFNQLQEGLEAKEILIYLDKVINVFYKSLTGYEWKRPEKNTFPWYLMQENGALAEKLDDIKKIIKQKELFTKRDELLAKIRELASFNDHYLKKENILFPYLEKKAPHYNGLSIMWALHDETRKRINNVIELLERNDSREPEINAALGNLFFAMYGLKLKEELILFPCAMEVIEAKEWDEMKRQSMEYGFPFIEKPDLSFEEKVGAQKVHEFISDFNEGYMFKTETGTLNFEQLLSIFNALPVDITYVDEDEKVRFFNRAKDRIFPRSPAVIGRDVKNCHPPGSVHIVKKIIDSFRTGEKDSASFWINAKGKMILIQYFALRDSEGRFKGTLEVSQDITEIKTLEGEKRLLDW